MFNWVKEVIPYLHQINQGFSHHCSTVLVDLPAEPHGSTVAVAPVDPNNPRPAKAKESSLKTSVGRFSVSLVNWMETWERCFLDVSFNPKYPKTPQVTSYFGRPIHTLPLLADPFVRVQWSLGKVNTKKTTVEYLWTLEFKSWIIAPKLHFSHSSRGTGVWHQISYPKPCGFAPSTKILWSGAWFFNKITEKSAGFLRLNNFFKTWKMIFASWNSPVNFVRVLTTAARLLHSKQCEDHIGDAYLRMSDALTYAQEKSLLDASNNGTRKIGGFSKCFAFSKKGLSQVSAIRCLSWCMTYFLLHKFTMSLYHILFWLIRHKCWAAKSS